MHDRSVRFWPFILAMLALFLVAESPPMLTRGAIAQESTRPLVNPELLNAALAVFAPFADGVPDDAIPSQSVFLRFEHARDAPLGFFSAMDPGGIIWDGMDKLEFAQVYNAAGDRLYFIDLRENRLLGVIDPAHSPEAASVPLPAPADLHEAEALLQAFVEADAQGRVSRDRVQLEETVFEASILQLRNILSENPERFECHLCREEFSDEQGSIVGDILYRPVVGIQLTQQRYDEGVGRRWRINQNSGEIEVTQQFVTLDAAVPPWYDQGAFVLYSMPTEADKAIIEHLLQACVRSA